MSISHLPLTHIPILEMENCSDHCIIREVFQIATFIICLNQISQKLKLYVYSFQLMYCILGYRTVPFKYEF